jgi:hypothetical protein
MRGERRGLGLSGAVAEAGAAAPLARLLGAAMDAHDPLAARPFFRGRSAALAELGRARGTLARALRGSCGDAAARPGLVASGALPDARRA